MNNTSSMKFDVTYGFVYSINSNIEIRLTEEDDGYKTIEVLSEYGELMYKSPFFEDVIKFISNLLNDEYTYERSNKRGDED